MDFAPRPTPGLITPTNFRPAAPPPAYDSVIDTPNFSSSRPLSHGSDDVWGLLGHRPSGGGGGVSALQRLGLSIPSAPPVKRPRMDNDKRTTTFAAPPPFTSSLPTVSPLPSPYGISTTTPSFPSTDDDDDDSDDEYDPLAESDDLVWEVTPEEEGPPSTSLASSSSVVLPLVAPLSSASSSPPSTPALTLAEQAAASPDATYAPPSPSVTSSTFWSAVASTTNRLKQQPALERREEIEPVAATLGFIMDLIRNGVPVSRPFVSRKAPNGWMQSDLDSYENDSLFLRLSTPPDCEEADHMPRKWR